MSSEATDSPSGPLDSPVSNIHIAKIAKDFVRNWEKLAPYLRLLPAHEDAIKRDGRRYDDQKREALLIWKELNGRKATYKALIVIAKEVSNVELAENIEALVASHPTLREVRPSPRPAANVEKIQRVDESSKVFEAHAPGHYKHNEDTTPTKDAVLPETSSALSRDLIPVQEPPLPSHTQSDTATPSLPADIPASPVKLSPSVQQSPIQWPSRDTGQQLSPIPPPRQPDLKSLNQEFNQIMSSIKIKKSVSLRQPELLHQSAPLRQSWPLFQHAPLHLSAPPIAISEYEPSILTPNMQHLAQESSTSVKKQVLQEDYNIAASLNRQVPQQCNSDNTELMEIKPHYKEVTEPIKSSCVTSTPPIETKVRLDILQNMFLKLRNTIHVAIVNKRIDIKAVVSCVMKYRVCSVEDQDKLKEWRDALLGLENMEVLFVRLSVHWNYLHPEIYDHFIKVFKLSSRVSDQCTKYCAELRTFLSHTCVIKFYDIVGKTERQEEIESMLVTKVNQCKWDPPVHLNQVDLFRKQNVHYCNLQQCAEIVVAKILVAKIMVGKRAVDQELLLVLKLIHLFPEIIRHFYTESRGIPMHSQLSHGADFTETVTSREAEMPGNGGDEGKEIAMEVKPTTEEPPKPKLSHGAHPDTSKEVEMAERKGKGNGKGEDERKENAMEVEPTTEVPPKPKVGERVNVSGSGTGTLRYVGTVKFASGIRMGVELDNPMPHSKSDGSRSGMTYFQCKPSHGMFLLPSRVKRMSPVDTSKRSRSRSSASGIESTNYHPSTLSSSPSPHSSSTANKRRLTVSNKSAPSPHTTSTSHPNILKIGMNVYVHKELGVVKFIGYTSFSDGVWLGVELKNPNGKNDGSVGGKRYFDCKPLFGLFVKPEKATHLGINCAKMLPESLSGKEQ